MSDSISNPAVNRPFWDELAEFWRHLPNKMLLAILLGGWMALFHFLGNSVLGYVKTDSLFGWMWYVFTTSSDDEHGLLIPLVVLALLWWKRRELQSLQKAIWWPALGLVVFGLIIHIAGFLVQQTRVSIVGFFIGLYGLIGLVWGRSCLRAIFFPYFLFVFCVPLGTISDSLTLPLRLVATQITTGAAALLGIHVVRDGTLIADASGKYAYEVAAACSGLRSLTAMFALTTIYAFLTFKTAWKRILMIGAAMPLAVACNVFRLSSIIIAAESFGHEAGDFVHEHLGILPYIPAIVGVILLGRWLREPSGASDLRQGGAAV